MWKSHRGDEWWYTGEIGKVSAICDGYNFIIEPITGGMNGLDKAVIHRFLHETFGRLKEFSIRLNHSAEIELILSTLVEENVATYEIQKSRYGKTIILKNIVSPRVTEEIEPIVLKPWWKIW